MEEEREDPLSRSLYKEKAKTVFYFTFGHFFVLLLGLLYKAGKSKRQTRVKNSTVLSTDGIMINLVQNPVHPTSHLMMDISAKNLCKTSLFLVGHFSNVE